MEIIYENYGITLSVQICIFDSLYLVLTESVESHKSNLSLKENGELAEAVQAFFVSLWHIEKEYKDKNVVMNAWKEVLGQVNFIANSSYIILSKFYTPRWGRYAINSALMMCWCERTQLLPVNLGLDIFQLLPLDVIH